MYDYIYLWIELDGWLYHNNEKKNPLSLSVKYAI